MAPTPPATAGSPRPAEPPSQNAGSKAERTRAAIIDAALTVFKDKGYEDATMRAIAAEAGVSVGNAYYYFASKEHLIQGFYDRAQVDHAAAAAPILARTVDLEERVRGVLHAWIDVFEPYRAFGGTFFKNAAEPSSPMSPFSPESEPSRTAAISLWTEVVRGSDAKVPKYLQAELPELLWLAMMGMVLFWVHDPTPRARRTRLLVDRMAPVLVKAIGLARLPGLRSTVMDLVELIGEIKKIG